MTAKIIFLFLIFSVSTFGQQQESHCELTLKKTPYFIRHSLFEKNDSIQVDFDILKKCGALDSLDRLFLLNESWLNVIMMHHLYLNDQVVTHDDALIYKPAVTYDSVLKYIDVYKKTKQYAEFRRAFIESSQTTEKQNNKDAFFEKYLNLNGFQTPPTPEKIEFSKLEDVKSAIKIAKKNGKRVLLYFSCYACVNARKVEDRILTYHPIKRLMAENFACFIAYTDDKSEDKKSNSTAGEKFIKIQAAKFKTNTQPYFCIINNDGQVLSEIGYTHLTEEFITFLTRGLK